VFPRTPLGLALPLAGPCYIPFLDSEVVGLTPSASQYFVCQLEDSLRSLLRHALSLCRQDPIWSCRRSDGFGWYLFRLAFLERGIHESRLELRRGPGSRVAQRWPTWARSGGRARDARAIPLFWIGGGLCWPLPRGALGVKTRARRLFLFGLVGHTHSWRKLKFPSTSSDAGEGRGFGVATNIFAPVERAGPWSNNCRGTRALIRNMAPPPPPPMKSNEVEAAVGKTLQARNKGSAPAYPQYSWAGQSHLGRRRKNNQRKIPARREPKVA